MLDAVRLGGGDRLADEVGGAVDRGALLFPTEKEAAGDVEDVLAGGGFELSPDFVGAHGVGDVVTPLADREAGEAGVAVGRSAIVRRGVLVDAEDARPPLRRLVERRAPHRPESDHDHIEMAVVRRAHRSPLPRIG